MKRKLEAVSVIAITCLIMMACSFGYEGVAIGDDPEDLERDMMRLTIEAMNMESVPQAAAATSEPEYKPVDPQSVDPFCVAIFLIVVNCEGDCCDPVR
jgi:hypothetical protein